MSKKQKHIAFDSRVTRAAKTHLCYTCEKAMNKGEVHIVYPATDEKYNFISYRLCIECSFLVSQKDGINRNSIKKGGFTDIMIPNRLRKKRAEFRANPRAAIIAAGLPETPPVHPPQPCNSIVVKVSEFQRKIFHLPESRYKVEQFGKGEQLTIRAGVNGQKREATIKGAWSTSGKMFGCNKRQVAILVA